MMVQFHTSDLNKAFVVLSWTRALIKYFWLETVEFAEKVKWFGSINFLSILSVMILMWTVMM